LIHSGNRKLQIVSTSSSSSSSSKKDSGYNSQQVKQLHNKTDLPVLQLDSNLQTFAQPEYAYQTGSSQAAKPSGGFTYVVSQTALINMNCHHQQIDDSQKVEKGQQPVSVSGGSKTIPRAAVTYKNSTPTRRR